MADEPERWLTIQQACAEIRVSRRTLYHYMDLQKVIWKRTTGNRRRILARSLWQEPKR